MYKIHQGQSAEQACICVCMEVESKQENVSAHELCLSTRSTVTQLKVVSLVTSGT